MKGGSSAEHALDLIRYSRRLGVAVTIVTALAMTVLISFVVRLAVMSTYQGAEELRVEYLRMLHPLPPASASTAELEQVLTRWIQQAAWSGVLLVGRPADRPVRVVAPAAGLTVPSAADLAAIDRPLIVAADRPDAPANGLFACRIELSSDLGKPEYVVVARPADDVERRLRSLYALLFVGITGMLGILFTALLTVVTHGEKLRRAALERHDALRRAHEEAQAALLQAAKMTALGELAAGVGHEINNPVAVVSNVLEVLAESPHAQDPQIKVGLADIDEAVGRIRKVVKNLSGFSMPQVADLAPVDLAPLLTRTVELAQLSIPTARRVQIDVAIPPDLPAINGQDGPLQQVFLNLLNNARHAVLERQAREPDLKPTIKIAATALPESVRVTVEDNGPGIAAEHLARLFEPFFTTKPRWQGTGLGLWVSHRIVGQHRGEFRVESAAGAGATFTVELPTVAAAAERSAKEAAAGG